MSNNTRIQLMCVWCIPLSALLFVGGVWVAGMLPPLSPASSASDIQRFFVENLNRIRVGAIMGILASTLTAGSTALICVQMKRVEGRESPLSYIQLITGLVGNVLALYPFFFLAVGVFREDRPAELMRLMFDMCWLANVGIVFPLMLNMASIGACGFLDKDEIVFPRWYAWFNIWAPFVFLVDLLIFFVKTGPFAFNGAISFWFELSLLGVWVTLTFVVFRRAVLNRESGQSNDQAKRALPTVEDTL